MKIADCHMHSFFSSDSEAPTEEMVKRAVELGLPAICLTDHYDMDYSTGEFQLDTERRRRDWLRGRFAHVHADRWLSARAFGERRAGD